MLGGTKTWLAKRVSQLSIDRVVWVGDCTLWALYQAMNTLFLLDTVKFLVKWYVQQGDNIGITSSTCTV